MVALFMINGTTINEHMLTIILIARTTKFLDFYDLQNNEQKCI